MNPVARVLEWIERKTFISSGSAPMEWGYASRQNGDNFRTNQVTLAEYNDQGSSAGGVMGLATAWACIRLVSGTISSLPLAVLKPSGESLKTAYDHPLYRVLHDSPNADQTALNFWQFISASVELHGNAYAEVVRASNGRVISLLPPFVPNLVKVVRQADGSLGYEASDGKGGRRVIAQENMLHIRGFGGDPLGGLSTLAFGRRTFGIALAIEHAAAATFRNGIRASGVMLIDKALSPEQRSQAEQALQGKYAGAMNNGVPMVLDNGVKWQSLSINPDDAQMLQSRAFSVEEICRFFSVPPHLIGHTEKTTSWGTGIEEMTLAFVKFSLRERLKNIESTLEKQLLTPLERAQGMRIEFNIEGLLRGDSKTRAEFYKAGLGTTQQPGWMVRNEVRALENLPPIDGWDDPIPLISERETITVPDPGNPPVPPA